MSSSDAMNSVLKSIDLSAHSFKILITEPGLIIFPILQGIILLFTVYVPLVAGMYFLGVLQKNFAALFTVVFVLYFFSGFITVFFSTAIIGNTLLRLSGKKATITSGFGIAFSRIGKIFGWALLSGTIGIIISVLEVKNVDSFFSRIIIALIGFSWTVASVLVIPVMIIENRRPVDALKRSWELVKEKKGTTVSGIIVIEAFSTYLWIIGTLILVIFTNIWPEYVLLWLALLALIVIFTSLLSSTINTIFIAELYDYALKSQNRGISP